MKRSECPIATALDLIGDKWTLVVLRDILFAHRYAFSQIAEQEGIASNILMERLERLVSADILQRHVDPADRRRRIYLPTASAIALIPVLVDLMVWGNAHTSATGAADIAAAASDDRDSVIQSLKAASLAKVAVAHNPLPL